MSAHLTASAPTGSSGYEPTLKALVEFARTPAHTQRMYAHVHQCAQTHNGGKRINLDTSLPLFPTTSISVHPQCPTAALTALRGRTWVYKPVVGHLQ